MSGAHVGQTGTVVTRIRGDRLPGEVRIVHRGVPHTFIAYAAEPLAVGTNVLVIAMLGPGKLEVERWELDLGSAGTSPTVSPV